MKRGDLQQADSAVFVVPVDAITIPEFRFKSLKEAEAKAIGEAILADRQYDPITIAQLPGRSDFTLIDGLHRLVGCRLVGILTVEARFGEADPTKRRRQEIISTWSRAGEDAFDRAAAMAYLSEQAGDDESAIRALGVDWGEETAEALGISRRTVFYYLKLARFYSAEQIATLRSGKQANELMPLIRLAAVPADVFPTAWSMIEAGADIAAALSAVAPGPVDAFSKAKKTFFGKIADWPAMERKRLIADLLAIYDRNGEPKDKAAQ